MKQNLKEKHVAHHAVLDTRFEAKSPTYIPAGFATTDQAIRALHSGEVPSVTVPDIPCITLDDTTVVASPSLPKDAEPPVAIAGPSEPNEGDDPIECITLDGSPVVGSPATESDESDGGRSDVVKFELHFLTPP